MAVDIIVVGSGPGGAVVASSLSFASAESSLAISVTCHEKSVQRGRHEQHCDKDVLLCKMSFP